MTKQIRINKRTVDAIRGDGSDHFYWDRDLPGFGLRVRAPPDASITSCNSGPTGIYAERLWVFTVPLLRIPRSDGHWP